MILHLHNIWVSALFAWSVWGLCCLRADVSASDRASVTWDLIAVVMFEFILIFDLSHMQSAVIFAYAAHITLPSAFECMTMYLLHCHKCTLLCNAERLHIISSKLLIELRYNALQQMQLLCSKCIEFVFWIVCNESQCQHYCNS